MFSEVVILYLKRFCSIKNTISYYWWEFSTCRFSKASFLLVTKQPSTGHRSIARPGLDDGPALLSDVQAGGTTTIAAGSSSRIVELGSSICSSSVFHWFHCLYPKRKYRARVPTILMPPTFPIASLNRYTKNFQGGPKSRTGVICLASSTLQSQPIRKVVYDFRCFLFFLDKISFPGQTVNLCL